MPTGHPHPSCKQDTFSYLEKATVTVTFGNRRNIFGLSATATHESYEYRSLPFEGRGGWGDFAYEDVKKKNRLGFASP